MRERLGGHGHAERVAERRPAIAGAPLDQGGGTAARMAALWRSNARLAAVSSHHCGVDAAPPFVRVAHRQDHERVGIGGDQLFEEGRGRPVDNGRIVGEQGVPIDLPYRAMRPNQYDVPKRVLLAAPRGYCAGVDRAVQAVEEALDLYGPPVYVRKEIVHNKHVVRQLAERGAIFVDQETEVPEGELVVFSAHGVAPSVHENAQARRLRTIDATCPLVTKVHVEARKFAEQGYTIILIGHQGHEEVEGTTGEAPASIVLVQTAEDVDRLELADPDRVAYITQTTLSVDETTGIIARLHDKFPNIVGPKSDDICYATTNRQIAVKRLARECDLVLVIGSTNSSNSNRLVEVAREHGAASHLIDNSLQVREEWLGGVETVGITSGASAPEELVEQLVSFFRDRGAADISELRTVDEDVRFMLPKEIRTELAARG